MIGNQIMQMTHQNINRSLPLLWKLLLKSKGKRVMRRGIPIKTVTEEGLFELVASCPSCDGTDWLLLVERGDMTVLQAFRCSSCGFEVALEDYYEKL